jgi:hypothetical protein
MYDTLENNDYGQTKDSLSTTAVKFSLGMHSTPQADDSV